jgi:hypothetical protein
VRGGGEENETHERTQGSTGVSSLPDVERDACDVVQALAGLAALLQGATGEHPVPEDVRGVVRRLVEDGAASAERVLAHLRALRGPGDGESVVVPPHLGMWCDWALPSGNVLGTAGVGRGDAGRAGAEWRMGRAYPRRSDPGE